MARASMFIRHQIRLPNLLENKSLRLKSKYLRNSKNSGGSWYRIKRGDERWVEKYVTIDKFWEKKAAEQAKMDVNRQKDKDAKEKKAKEKADRIEKARKEWMEATDKKSGQKYWYNVETSETTWESPFK